MERDKGGYTVCRRRWWRVRGRNGSFFSFKNWRNEEEQLIGEMWGLRWWEEKWENASVKEGNGALEATGLETDPSVI